jgi:hypothetical protein
MTKIGALKKMDPAAWVRKVRAAFAKNATMAEAAKKLGCSRATLQLWVQKDAGLLEGIVRRSPGWEKGRLRGSVRN